MMNTSVKQPELKVADSLRQYGLALLDDLYTSEQIKSWNRLIDQHFQNTSPMERRYLNASDLLQLGIAAEVLSESLLETINEIMPDAALYHFHFYDIPGNTQTPHIHGQNGLKGWHRDDDCFFGWEKHRFHFISFFVYLTDVKSESGPFEIAPLNKDQALKNKTPTTKVLGPSGSNFIFDRTYWHRANPNLSEHNRRVIKLSFQNDYLPNDRINLEEFSALKRSHLTRSSLLKQWLMMKEA